jgi:inner membrane protease subunit 2
VDIPQGRCWVEGDNSARSASSADSRTAFGPVHLGLLEGRVSHIVWPPSRVGRVAVAPQPQRVLEADSGAWEAGDG